MGAKRMTTMHTKKVMKAAELDAARNPDIAGSYVAIKRAAKQAWLVAQRTGTALIVSKAGKTVRVMPKPDDQNK